MIQGKNRRLANVKTRRETGLDYVMFSLDLNTPFGKKQLKEVRPYYPGEEAELRDELDRVEQMIAFVKQNQILTDKIQEVFMEVKDATLTIERSGAVTLSTVELFEIKSLLLQMRQLRKLTMEHEIGDYQGAHCCCAAEPSADSAASEARAENMPAARAEGEAAVDTVPQEYFLADTEDLLDELDPRRDRMNTFYIYNEFSPKLDAYRTKKKEYEQQIRREQKQAREELRKKYGVQLTPKFDIVVAKSHPDFEMIQSLEELEMTDQDYMSVTLQLKPTEKIYEFVQAAEALNAEIEQEEERVREMLSRKIAEKEAVLLENCEKMGALDLALARAIYAMKHDLTKPEIVEDHVISFEDGRNLQVEDIIREKGKTFCPISLSLADGVTMITGANMGGKTISLKLAGQIPILAQYGFFVPAKHAKIGLSNYMQILIGDSQSVERGLSSFGSEMEELKEILDKGQERSLILIDEIASGTNPTEGTALTKSLVDYLIEKPYISLITTHFESVTERKDIVNMQVRGLADCNFTLLNREIQHANRRDRINIISKYMDYRLYRVDSEAQVPKEALSIAAMLGINKEIIEGAKKYMK
ncbi:MAG: MutS-related protein [Clostridia bacterium]